MPKKHTPRLEETIVVGIFRLLGAFIMLPWRLVRSTAKHGPRQRSSLDYVAIARGWDEVMELSRLSGSAHFRQAVIQADTLFDHVLRQFGLEGETMGERLQAAQGLLERDVYNEVWQAHKLRNCLAHEVGSEVMNYEATEALRQFEHGLVALGVLKRG